MEITSREQRRVVILDVAGKLASGVGGVGLSEAVMRHLGADLAAGDRSRSRVLLNLGACTGADSLGIGELVSLHVGLANRGATLKLLRLPDRIRDLLTATQLIFMFEIFDDEEEALASFA